MLEHNVTAVLDRVRHLATERDIGVIFVSHKMPEVMAVSDRVVVLRDGHRTGLYATISDELLRASPEERRDNPRSTAAKGRWAVRAGGGISSPAFVLRGKR